MEIWPGEPYPLGATFDGAGTNFSVFSMVAEQVEVCLFDDEGTEKRIRLPEVTAHQHHGYIPGIGPGTRYGFRVHGPNDPKRGHRCNPEKLLIDPYAKAISGRVDWHPSVFGYKLGKPNGPAELSDSAEHVPRSVVVNPYFDWRGDRAPRTPWHKTVIYEVHVRGFTMLHPDVPEHLRGTYAGLAHPAIIEYFQKLGVTAVELLPVHHFIHDHRLVEAGLRNYWGYNSIGYFAPHDEYSTSGGHPYQQVQEFKEMVRTLHAAGIEVILDVVYNHTAEGDHRGPTLCFRGLDNAEYYRVSSEDPSRYVDFTGCGNSLNMRCPHVLQLIMDSLRYWVQEMHVDGFRFDLASALARELHDVDRLAAFFDLIQQDPITQRVKLIAEPWDLGEGGYQVGNFPPLWSEWNGKFRDCVRDFWRSKEQTLAEFASRFTGSSDLYESSARRPHASINFVTCHDGFTLRDLVSYNGKHNLANGEGNRDGEHHNRSWNCGVEGPTDDPGVQALRARQQRNFLATLFLSQGVPMLLAGDELGRTQQGNNNAYCQDSEISWLDWNDVDPDLLEFTRKLVHFVNKHPVLRRRNWFQGRSIRGQSLTDIGWFTPNGTEMTDRDWQAAYARCIGVYLNGDGIASVGTRGQQIRDDSFYVLFNAYHESVDFSIPEALGETHFNKVLDTCSGFDADFTVIETGSTIEVEARSLLVLQRLDCAISI
ncbi:MAG: glycogen debranching protein GlgX [Deltaproteobacteria bacterium]|nr:glycogen debranching protein GlgX [Deltaproteobacteria bacterium]